MKRLLFISLVFIACTKDETTTRLTGIEVCDLYSSYSKETRPHVTDVLMEYGNYKLPEVNAVILLDFDGHTIENTSWNNSAATIVATHSGLTELEQLKVRDSVREDYKYFDVFVTVDEGIYNQAPIYKRTRVVITQHYSWYSGNVAGVAYIGSFNWGDNTPCFVFSGRLGFDVKKIQEAVSHESGHTIGLRHQSKCENGIIINQYNGGNQIEAPIMGVSYYAANGKWWNGTTWACNAFQNDSLIIANKLQ